MADANSRGLEPSAKLRDHMDELAMFSIIARNGLTWGQVALRYEEVVGKRSQRAKSGREPTEEEQNMRRQHAERIQEFAERQSEAGFPYLYNLLTIRVWAILENLIDEVVAERVRDTDKLTQLQEIENLQVPIVQYLRATQDERTEFVVDAIKQASKSPLKRGVGRFEAILASVHLAGTVPESIKRAVLELSEIRNVIVHRDGVCDRRIIERCPWLNLGVGDVVAVDAEQFERYRKIPVWYIFEIERRAGTIEQDIVDDVDQDLEEFERWFKATEKEI